MDVRGRLNDLAVEEGEVRGEWGADCLAGGEI